MTAVVGRDRELAEITTFLDLADGAPRVLLIEGDAGIGKTTLWRAAVDDAHARGHRVLACAGAESETQLSFAALRDALGDAFADVADELPAPQRHALAATLLLEDDPTTPQEPAVIAAATLSALRLLATRAPIVVAVDDVQWLDGPSADVLGYVSRRLGDEPVAMLLARRTGEMAGTLALGRLGNRLGVLPVAGMSVGALGRILNDRVGATYPRPVLHRVHEVSGGNPFYAVELARALGDEPHLSPGEALPVLGTLRELVRTRLAALPAETVDVLAVAAAVRRPSLTVVEAALGADPAPALAPAEAAHIAERDGEEIRFAHPLFAAGAYELMRATARRETHRRLAAVVSDPEERARHLALAAEEPDEEIAALLEQGAHAAFGRGSPSSAAELMELAIELTPPEPTERMAERQAEQGRYYVLAGNFADAAAALEPAVEKLPIGGKRADALLNLVHASEGDSFDEAIERCEAALEDARGDDVRTARIEGYLGALLGFRDGDSEEAISHLRAALRAAERSADETSLLDALMNLCSHEFLFAPPPTPGLLERAVDLEERGLRIWPIHSAPTVLLGLRRMYAGRLNEARERFESAIASAASTGDEASEAVVRLFLTEVECKAGNWQLAARYASEGYEGVELVGHDQLLSGLLYARALVAAHLGRVEDARANADRGLALANSVGDRVFRFQNLGVLGFVELSLGDHAAASGRLQALAEEASSSGWADPGFCGELPNAIEAFVELGDLDEAERLLGELDARRAIVEGPWAVASAARCRGMILAARGDFPAAFEAYESALVAHDQLLQPFECARTLLALGKAQRRARQRAAARETLGAALAIFDELGAELWAGKARDELARIGGRAPASDGLTPSEQRIADLVAEGKTNKEVAAILVVTDRTVESALTQIYRKLDVRSRTELAHKLAASA